MFFFEVLVAHGKDGKAKYKKEPPSIMRFFLTGKGFEEAKASLPDHLKSIEVWLVLHHWACPFNCDGTHSFSLNPKPTDETAVKRHELKEATVF